MIHYFAYGSNLDTEQMQKRCPGSRVVGTGRLPGYRLGFTRWSTKRGCGVADVTRREGDDVWGLVYELSDEHLRSLDRYEGHPYAYARFQVTIDVGAGSLTHVWVYSVREKAGFVAPSRGYLDIIKGAAARHGFPDSYLRALGEVEVASSPE